MTETRQLITDHCSRSPAPITSDVLIPGVRAMPEATFNNHRNATRTQRPPSVLMPLAPYVATSPLLRRYSLPDVTTMRHYEKTVLTKRTHSQVLLQSRFPAPRPTRLSNPAGWVSTAARGRVDESCFFLSRLHRRKPDERGAIDVGRSSIPISSPPPKTAARVAGCPRRRRRSIAKRTRRR